MKLRYETHTRTQHTRTRSDVHGRAYTLALATLSTASVYIDLRAVALSDARVWSTEREHAFCRAVASNFPLNAVTNVSDSGIFIF